MALLVYFVCNILSFTGVLLGQVAPTDDELAAATSETPLVQDDLVKVEGTKVVLKKDLLEQ